MIAISADVGQVHAERDARHGIDQGLQGVQRLRHAGHRRQLAPRPGDDLGPAIQRGQRLQRAHGILAQPVDTARQFGQPRHVLLAQQRAQVAGMARGLRVGVENGAHHTRMAQVQAGIAHAGGGQRVHDQLDDFQVGLEAGMAVDFGADLQQFAARQQVGRTRVQDAAAVAQARHAGTVEQMGVDARDLRGHIRAYAQGATGQLVDQLAGAQIQIAAGTRQQRIDVFDQRRRDQLETVGTVEIEQFATQFLNAPGLGR
ncbi:Uncharacterised protein [Bordetella pertussis]|nr:Uncharacterised protein [Bordetella pertussis]CPN82945.1 Uncharacterised protein [Bordetella pertussis]